MNAVYSGLKFITWFISTCWLNASKGIGIQMCYAIVFCNVSWEYFHTLISACVLSIANSEGKKKTALPYILVKGAKWWRGSVCLKAFFASQWKFQTGLRGRGKRVFLTLLLHGSPIHTSMFCPCWILSALPVRCFSFALRLGLFVCLFVLKQDLVAAGLFFFKV